MFDVITFGSAVVDVFVHTDIAEKKHFIYYPVGEKILIKELRFDIGGGGTNTAVAFSRLGLKTGYIGKVGDDDNGKAVLSLLKKERVKFLGRQVKNEKTGYSVILDSRGGERTILTYKGINNHVNFDDFKLRKLKTKWIYYSSLLEESLETQKKLLGILKQKGVKFAFNPSSYLIKSQDLGPLLKQCDVLILNKEEAELLAGKKEKVLEEIRKMGPKIVVVTDRDNVINCYDGCHEYEIVPNKVKVVERTGAGDAFASGFVAGQIVGMPIEKCLELGLKEGESVLGYFGAKNNLIKMDIKR